ncbi:hypothetical protein SI65_09718 [Aspergillus cristatus]|uniref:Uncharacterized protein n=1 Tax=Aspergillus cristatus TaxID=573508 RepID=A0A1E3B3F3_ASPCR|nr:hypothetical protein SI65_09718 [Aspergillus cristatus]
MERVILSNRFVNELRSLPEEVLSLRKAMDERHFGGYTTLNIIQLSHLQNDVCRHQLQQNLGSLIPVMYEEMKNALSQQLAQCDTQNWQTANVYRTVLGSVAQVTSRAFVGLPLCRDPKWLETAIGYTGDVFAVSQDLRDKHWLARPFIYIFLQSRKRLQARVQAGRSMLIPLLKARAEQLPEKPQSDLLQWMTESARGADKAPYRLSDKILFLCLASIHTSSSTAVHILYDLCQYAEDCVPVLREEITRIIAENGLTLASINKMKKLDSFLKESQRINHPGTLAFNRKVVKPITLSNGVGLAPGSFISMPSAEIARDPANYTNPEEFNPWRFEQKRNASQSEANKHQFVSTSVESLPFGMGKFACPGRFFAAGMIKILLIILITQYEFQFPGEQKKRPINSYLDERIAPSTTQAMKFRRVSQ